MSYPAIEAKGVRFSYGKNEILHGMDFAVQKGQLVAVLGPKAPEKVRCSAACWGCTTATRAASP